VILFGDVALLDAQEHRARARRRVNEAERRHDAPPERIDSPAEHRNGACRHAQLPSFVEVIVVDTEQLHRPDPLRLFSGSKVRDDVAVRPHQRHAKVDFMLDLVEVEVVLDALRTEQVGHLREPFLAAFDALPRPVETEDVKVGAESDELWIPAEQHVPEPAVVGARR
jgi:hypothetical protein